MFAIKAVDSSMCRNEDKEEDFFVVFVVQYVLSKSSAFFDPLPFFFCQMVVPLQRARRAMRQLAVIISMAVLMAKLADSQTYGTMLDNTLDFKYLFYFFIVYFLLAVA